MKKAVLWLLVAALSLFRSVVLSYECDGKRYYPNTTQMAYPYDPTGIWVCAVEFYILEKGGCKSKAVQYRLQIKHFVPHCIYKYYTDTCFCVGDYCNSPQSKLRGQFERFFEHRYVHGDGVPDSDSCRHNTELFQGSGVLVGQAYPYYLCETSLKGENCDFNHYTCFSNTRLVHPDPGCVVKDEELSCYCQYARGEQMCTANMSSLVSKFEKYFLFYYARNLKNHPLDQCRGVKAVSENRPRIAYGKYKIDGQYICGSHLILKPNGKECLFSTMPCYFTSIMDVPPFVYSENDLRYFCSGWDCNSDRTSVLQKIDLLMQIGPEPVKNHAVKTCMIGRIRQEYAKTSAAITPTDAITVYPIATTENTSTSTEAISTSNSPLAHENTDTKSILTTPSTAEIFPITTMTIINTEIINSEATSTPSKESHYFARTTTNGRSTDNNPGSGSDGTGEDDTSTTLESTVEGSGELTSEEGKEEEGKDEGKDEGKEGAEKTKDSNIPLTIGVSSSAVVIFLVVVAVVVRCCFWKRKGGNKKGKPVRERVIEVEMKPFFGPLPKPPTPPTSAAATPPTTTTLTPTAPETSSQTPEGNPKKVKAPRRRLTPGEIIAKRQAKQLRRAELKKKAEIPVDVLSDRRFQKKGPLHFTNVQRELPDDPLTQSGSMTGTGPVEFDDRGNELFYLGTDIEIIDDSIRTRPTQDEDDVEKTQSDDVEEKKKEKKKKEKKKKRKNSKGTGQKRKKKRRTSKAGASMKK